MQYLEHSIVLEVIPGEEYIHLGVALAAHLQFTVIYSYIKASITSNSSGSSMYCLNALKHMQLIVKFTSVGTKVV